MRSEGIMSARNHLSEAVPYAVEKALTHLGGKLRTARLRRNITMEEMAGKLGVSRYVIADAERGKPTTGIAVYAGMLWALDLLSDLEAVAAPTLDREGMVHSLVGDRKRARQAKPKGLDNDF
jgi:transcriptional regulator with XRE-family HTH domain